MYVKLVTKGFSQGHREPPVGGFAPVLTGTRLTPHSQRLLHRSSSTSVDWASGDHSEAGAASGSEDLGRGGGELEGCEEEGCVVGRRFNEELI